MLKHKPTPPDFFALSLFDQSHNKQSSKSICSKNEKRRIKYLLENESNREKRKDYYKLNSERILKSQKEYLNSNLEFKQKYKEYQREYHKSEKYKEYKLNNSEKIKSYDKKYRKRPDVRKIIIRKLAERTRKRKSQCPLYNLTISIRSSISNNFRLGGFKKSKKTEEILGCSFDEFKSYLENKFEEWMNWDNKGIYNGNFNSGWDIDHIIPICKACCEEDVIRLNHHTNLQPLCSKINREIKR